VHYCSLNESAVLSRKFILDRWNVLRPSQICIALAILGDSGDHVPGIHGWGPKRVKELFKKVTKEMNLDEALQVIVKQIPESLLPVFYESLDLTVLDPDVPGVPSPLEVSFASVALVKALGFPMLTGRYVQVKRAYEISEESVMRAIDEA
jgi:5'-3' exonuclease